MKVERLGWLGLRTDRFPETVEFFERTLGARVARRDPHRVMFELGNGDPIDVWDGEAPENTHFGAAPVVGFAVDDVDRARQELERAGVELIGPVQRGSGFAWAHFRGPDGNLYELQQREPTS